MIQFFVYQINYYVRRLRCNCLVLECLLFFLFAFFLHGCCADIGCFDNYTIYVKSISGQLRPGSYIIESTANNKKYNCSFELFGNEQLKHSEGCLTDFFILREIRSSGGIALQVIGNPTTIEIIIKYKQNLVFKEIITTHFSPKYPNGLICGPICSAGERTVSIGTD